VKVELRLARIATACAVVSLALAGLYPGNNPDTFGHVAQGRQIIELGHVPKYDTWSLLTGPPRVWHNYEWLSDALFYSLYSHFGYGAITLAKCTLLASMVLLLTATARALGGVRAELFTALTVMASVPACRIRLSDRPHVFGLWLGALYVFLLVRLQRDDLHCTRRERLWLITGLSFAHVCWVNLHGSHVLGLLITSVFFVFGQRSARAWIGLGLCLQAIASCISPYGPSIVLDAFAHLVDQRYRSLISEWQPWRPEDPPWLQLGPALHGALLTLVAARAVRLGNAAHAMVVLAFVLGVACFRSIRFIADFLLLSSALLGVGLALASKPLETRKLVLLGSACLALLAIAVPRGAAALPPYAAIGLGQSTHDLPVGSGTVLARNLPQARVFTSMNDAWFLMYAAPHARFVIDGRAPFYGPEHVAMATRAFADPDLFARVMTRFRVDTVLAKHALNGEQALTRRLRTDPRWALLLIEDRHALYVRRDVANQHGLHSLDALEPSYDLSWLLAAEPARAQAIRQELVALANVEGTAGYRAFVEAVLLLAPLKRGGAADGFRWPRNEHDWNVYRRVFPLLARSQAAVESVPVVNALYVSIAAALCRFDVAQQALARAFEMEVSREPLLAQQELALRQGHVAEVRKVIEPARALPQGRTDPWLAELAQGVAHPPRCPSAAGVD
jgi:hypothetical protein